MKQIFLFRFVLTKLTMYDEDCIYQSVLPATFRNSAVFIFTIVVQNGLL